jgi:uncharacterized protein DUF6289
VTRAKGDADMIRRILVVAAVAAAGLVPFLTVPVANAIPICKEGYDCLYVYYSTIARTTPIGYWSISCNGTSSHSGETSAYFNFSEALCNDQS